MAIKVLMPALSPTMTEGNLAKWHKKIGDQVNPGDVIAEIETDKATMEVEAVDEGTLGAIYVEAGTENVAVNTPIAVILEEGESLKDVKEEAPKEDTNIVSFSKSEAKLEVKEERKKDVKENERVFISPLAKRMAEEHDVNYAQITGTGPHGRIVKADIESYMKQPAPQKQIVASAEEYQLVPHTQMRKVIAKRLTEAKATIPHYYLERSLHIDKLLELREALNERLEEGKISVNDMLIKACALALKKVPDANCSWQDDGLITYNYAHIAVAVSIPGGLVTPVIRYAEQKSLKEISSEIKALAEKARAGKLAPEEYQDGTFSLSNLGMFGVDTFSAIINPPQASILAVGRGVQVPIINEKGKVKAATQMKATLSLDHRAIDGALGATFLSAIAAYVEDPLSLLL